LSELNKRRAELVAEGVDPVEVNKAYTKARSELVKPTPRYVEIPLEYPEKKEYTMYRVYNIVGRSEDRNCLIINRDSAYV
jgi:hypothetical protein